MSETPKWYVIHTFSGYENKVASSIMKAVENRKLQDIITEVTIPVETVREVKEDGSVREIERKLFPSYVLVKMILTDESWYLVRNTRGCTGFVSPNSNKPLPLTDEEAAQWGANTRETVEIELSCKVGDSVRINGGPFDGFVGTIDEIDVPENRVYLTITVFGRPTSVDLDLSQVQVVEE